jgi:MtaA/CmuA family methyltransferase
VLGFHSTQVTAVSSRERVLKTLSLGQPDRVPVIPFVISFAAKYAGFKYFDYCRDADKLAEAQMATAERFKIDAVYVDSDPVIEIEAMGARVDYSDDEAPTASRPAVESLEDIRSLKVPNPNEDGRLPVWLKAIRILKEQVGGKLAVFANINGPFQAAAQLRGIMGICTDFYRNPGLVSELLDFTCETATAFAKSEIEAGADAIVLGDAMSSPNLISPSHFAQFSFPYIRKVIRETGRDAPFFLHICGDSTLIIDKMAETGARFLEVDAQVDLAMIRQKHGGLVGIRGNISPMLLLNGKPHEIEDSCRKAMEAAAHPGGFILGSGCELPKNTPHANLDRMITAAEKFGRYS